MDIKVHDLFGLRKVQGEIGLEIELEGNNVSLITAPGWRAERDGSLRGESCELVLKEPIPRDKAHYYTAAVNRKADAVDAKVLDTGRAGVHVHVNCQNLTMTQVYNFICGYLIFEDLLIEFCGDHRVGNLFCLRSRDADHMLQFLRSAANTREYQLLGSDDIRYAALNVNSIVRYGSLEFRAMRSTIDPDVIQNWVTLLTSIKDWAINHKNPQEMVHDFSLKGTRNIFDEVFKGLDFIRYDDELMYEGVRNAQYLAFGVEDWEFDLHTAMAELVADPRCEHWVHAEMVIEYLGSPKRFAREIPMMNSLYKDLQRFLEDFREGRRARKAKKPADQFNPFDNIVLHRGPRIEIEDDEDEHPEGDEDEEWPDFEDAEIPEPAQHVPEGFHGNREEYMQAVRRVEEAHRRRQEEHLQRMREQARPRGRNRFAADQWGPVVARNPNEQIDHDENMRRLDALVAEHIERMHANRNINIDEE